MQVQYDANGKRRYSFSLGRFILNAVPNFANTGSPSISPEELDRVFSFQQSLNPPRKLTPASLVVAKIVDEEKTGGWVIKRLQKLGILSLDASDLPASPYVVTPKIGPNFANQVPWISSYAQKRLVWLLFDWEEECRRWDVLEAEERELKTIIAEHRHLGEDVGSYEKRLLELEGLKALRPGLRAKREQSVADAPPAYEHAGRA
jgi:hypothetical protein